MEYFKHHSGIGNCFVAILLIMILQLLLNTCVFPYEPKIEKYENLLVVDGLLTNLPCNCFVSLSRTYPYEAKRYLTESKAIVKIIDDRGMETILHEEHDGLYLPEDTCFAGDIGRKYKVYIETASGEICESEMEELKEPVDIADVSYKFEEKKDGVQGFQIFIDTYDRNSRSFYYSWDYAETWEFWVPYMSRSDYLPEMKICYKENASRKIAIESTKGYVADKVIGYPLYFIDNTTNRLSSKYSVLIRQYVLTEKTYQFYRNLKNINENTGTLFDRTPVILVGNLVSKSNPKQPVLGNFQVSGASEKRIFISRADLPPGMSVTTEYEFCKSALYSRKENSLQIDSLVRSGWVGMDTIPDPVAKDTFIGLVISRSCFDCRTKGKLEKPEFWDTL